MFLYLFLFIRKTMMRKLLLEWSFLVIFEFSKILEIIIIASVWTLKWKFCFVKFLKFHSVWPWVTSMTLLQWYCLSLVTWSIIWNHLECFWISLKFSEYRFLPGVREVNLGQKKEATPKIGDGNVYIIVNKNSKQTH